MKYFKLIFAVILICSAIWLGFCLFSGIEFYPNSTPYDIRVLEAIQESWKSLLIGIAATLSVIFSFILITKIPQ